MVFLISDFQSENFEKSLRVLSKRHDLIALSVIDPREISMPGVGLIELEDSETGEIIVIDTGSQSVRNEYEKFGTERVGSLKDLFRSINVDYAEIITDQDYVKEIVKFFRGRERRMQH